VYADLMLVARVFLDAFYQQFKMLVVVPRGYQNAENSIFWLGITDKGYLLIQQEIYHLFIFAAKLKLFSIFAAIL
jgi:hypothetical protein